MTHQMFYKSWVKSGRISPTYGFGQGSAGFFDPVEVLALQQHLSSTMQSREVVKELQISYHKLEKLRAEGLLKPVAGPTVDGSAGYRYRQEDVRSLKPAYGGRSIPIGDTIGSYRAAKLAGISVNGLCKMWKSFQWLRRPILLPTGARYYRDDVMALRAFLENTVGGSEAIRELGVSAGTLYYRLIPAERLRPVSGPGIDGQRYWRFRKDDIQRLRMDLVSQRRT